MPGACPNSASWRSPSPIWPLTGSCWKHWPPSARRRAASPPDLPGELEDAALYYDYATGMVQIQVGAWGLAPSSTHWGVYFSPEDSPLPYDGAQVSLTPQGQGFAWEREGNIGYTQRLEQDWYFFTASF